MKFFEAPSNNSEAEAAAKKAEETALYDDGLDMESFEKSQENPGNSNEDASKNGGDSEWAAPVGEMTDLQSFLPEERFNLPGIIERPITKEELLVKLEDTLKKAESLVTAVLMNEGAYNHLAERWYKQGRQMEKDDKEKIEEIQSVCNQITLLKKALDGYLYLDPDMNRILERLTDNVNFFAAHNLVSGHNVEMGKLEL